MSYADGELELSSGLQIEDMDIAIRVVAKFHAVGGQVCVESIEINGERVPLSQEDYESIADHIAGLAPR